jgi:hypothetical protein
VSSEDRPSCRTPPHTNPFKKRHTEIMKVSSAAPSLASRQPCCSWTIAEEMGEKKNSLLALSSSSPRSPPYLYHSPPIVSRHDSQIKRSGSRRAQRPAPLHIATFAIPSHAPRCANLPRVFASAPGPSDIGNLQSSPVLPAAAKCCIHHLSLYHLHLSITIASSLGPAVRFGRRQPCPSHGANSAT